MIFETHADVTRLGYFRLIPILSSMVKNENKVIRQDLLARRLWECCLKAEGILEKPRPTGIINGLTNARNYIAVAQNMLILDQRTREPGLFGKLYLSLESSKSFERFAKGEARLSLEDILNLSRPERLFFLWVVSIADFPFIQAILKWILQQKEFKRGEAINAIMEEIYPAVLKKVIDAEEASEKKRSIKRRIAEAKKWKEKRTRTDKYEWIKTKQYNTYYHTAVPRIEFLIDLGILKKIGRGKYCVREKVLRNSNIILEMCEKEKNEIGEYIFEMFKIIADEVYEPREASKYEIMKEMVRAYSRLNQFRIPKLDLLEKVTALLLLENGKHARLNEIHETFNRLFLQFPGKIYIADDGNNGINVTQMELDDI